MNNNLKCIITNSQYMSSKGLASVSPLGYIVGTKEAKSIS